MITLVHYITDINLKTFLSGEEKQVFFYIRQGTGEEERRPSHAWRTLHHERDEEGHRTPRTHKEKKRQVISSG